MPQLFGNHFRFVNAFRGCRGVMRKFRRFDNWDKCYAIGALLSAALVTTMLVLSLRRTGPQSELSLITLFSAPMVMFAAGVGFEFAPKVRSLWGTTGGKIALALFSGLCVFIADLYGRVFIYKVTGENPDAFPSARTALIWIYSPLFWILGLCGCAIAGALMSFIALVASPVRWFVQWLINTLPTRIVFGHRRQHFQQRSIIALEKEMVRLCGFLGWFLFAAFGFHWFARFQDRSDVVRRVIVFTGFTPVVPPDRYTTIKPNSGVNFLPGDRVCVAEPLPGGKVSIRTMQRSDLK